MASGTTIKLSILARRKRFPRLPGQPEGASFGILWDAGPIPADGVCYVVEFVDRSSARILGYVATGGRVFRRGEAGARASDPDELALALVRDEGRFSATSTSADRAADWSAPRRFAGPSPGPCARSRT